MGEYRRIDPQTIPDPRLDPLLSQATEKLPRVGEKPSAARRARLFLMPEASWIEKLKKRRA